jgi:hypothetical protein
MSSKKKVLKSQKSKGEKSVKESQKLDSQSVKSVKKDEAQNENPDNSIAPLLDVD